VNVTPTDLAGRLVETGDVLQRFAISCDIATPMEREGDNAFSVDLFLEALILATCRRTGSVTRMSSGGQSTAA
jgi:hypothetical protein